MRPQHKTLATTAEPQGRVMGVVTAVSLGVQP